MKEGHVYKKLQTSEEPALVKPSSAQQEEQPSAPCKIGKGFSVALLVLISVAILISLNIQPIDNDGSLLTAYRSTLDVQASLKSLMSDQAILWTGNTMSATEALNTLVGSSSALLIVTMGPKKPTRRDDTVPFLTTSPEVSYLPTKAINTAASVLETALGRKLFPMRIEVVDMAAKVCPFHGPMRPYAIWEVGTGSILLDKTLASNTWEKNTKANRMTELMIEKLFGGMAQALTTTASAHAAQYRLQDLSGLMGPVLSAAVAAAFAAAPPLWFCILCPSVLGLIAPLLINIGLNQLAGFLCTHLSLPDDQCFDVMLGALGLGFVLALASAIPIFFVCQLQECSHRGVQPLAPNKKPCRMGKLWSA